MNYHFTKQKEMTRETERENRRKETTQKKKILRNNIIINRKYNKILSRYKLYWLKAAKFLVARINVNIEQANIHIIHTHKIMII